MFALITRLRRRYARSDYVKRQFQRHNMRAAVHMTLIVLVLEAWMIVSLTRAVVESALAGEPRSLGWIASHGGWYVGFFAMALVTLVHALRYVRNGACNERRTRALLLVFCFVALLFGMHFGGSSFMKGEQILAFVTMTLFVFGMLVWTPLTAFLGTTLTFGSFYLYISRAAEVTYGTQVNLFTLWISTFVVALSTFWQVLDATRKDERLEEANSRLQQLASFDELTGIPNMHSFNSAVSVLFEGIEEFDVRYAVLYMDIENFKAYNDKHGFLAGNDLLREVADGLTRIFENELVARFSDDHFVALCEADVAEERALRAHELVSKLRGDVRLHLKTGLYEPEMVEQVNISQACDKARYACGSIKRHPGVHLARYDERLDTEVQRRQYVVNNVKQALSDGWIEVYYQPVVRCADGSGALYGYEALARWNDPTYGFMPPFAFVGTLEEFREIDKLDRCIAELVCKDLRAALDAEETPSPVSLNFSRLDFELFDVPAFLTQLCKTYELPTGLLDVEITESALSNKLGELQHTMDRLRAAGFSLWLDDFGSGYSSLNTLKDFGFDVLKIDMAFLRGFETNPKARPILRSIVDLAHELGMVTLCEGVETREQFEFLSSIGCDRAQGYHFGKPDPEKRLGA